MTLQAGVAREIITPKVGAYLFGYNDHCVSHSVHDNLTVTALALETPSSAGQDSAKILLLSATVCLFQTALADEIRAKAGEAAGIPAEQVILSATHTHSGPRTDGFSKWGEIDREYCDSILMPKCVKAAALAAASAQEVKTGFGTTESMTGINRRQLSIDGRVSLGQNPWDMYDPLMTVIALVKPDGKPFVNIVHIGTHCTAAGICDEISRDWAGFMIDRLEQESGAITMFLNGTAGDVAPRMANAGSTGDMRHAAEVGAVAGIDAVRAWRSIKTHNSETLSKISGDISVPFEPAIPQKDIQGRLAAMPEGWSWEKSALERLNELYISGRTGPDSLAFRQTIVRLGPAVFVPFPFETCTEIGLRLRHYSPFGHTLLVSCTNGSNSYLPAQSQLCRGGYEVESFRWFRPRRLPDNTDTLLIKQNLELIEKLNREK